MDLGAVDGEHLDAHAARRIVLSRSVCIAPPSAQSSFDIPFSGRGFREVVRRRLADRRFASVWRHRTTAPALASPATCA
jgi:hypothetical protein